LIHDESVNDPTLAFLLSRLIFPDFPECLGVFRAVDKSTYDALLHRQVAEARAAKGPAKLEQLLAGDETWTVG
jgi:2-oxoglutarate ferredoxin oxidoreductase subunit beta